MKPKFAGRKEKSIKVYFEVPTKWVDLDSPLGVVGWTLKGEIKDALKKALTEQYLEKAEMPEIEITKEELKKAVLDKLAQKYIDDKEVSDGY